MDRPLRRAVVMGLLRPSVQRFSRVWQSVDENMEPSAVYWPICACCGLVKLDDRSTQAAFDLCQAPRARRHYPTRGRKAVGAPTQVSADGRITSGPAFALVK